MTLDNMTGITKGSYTGFCKSQLITCNRVNECNGVCPFEDALKHADQMQTMNVQHTVDHDREWIIGCIKHDGFIKTDRFDKANQIILDALSADAEFADLPDIPRAYYERIVGNMAHEINMLKEQLESAVSREFYNDAVKANIRILMENRELKEQIESAEETMVVQTGQTHGKSAYIKELAEVVRCKDCRHFTHYADGCGVCTEKDRILTYQNQNDFCSYGERSEE